MALPLFPWFSSDARAKRRAEELAANDYDLLEQLVRIRQDRGLTQSQVAELLGVTQQAISKFEQPGADPRLSTIRQYSHAIGALVKHVSAPDEGQLQQSDRWIEISFVAEARSTNIEQPPQQFAANVKRSYLALAA